MNTSDINIDDHQPIGKQPAKPVYVPVIPYSEDKLDIPRSLLVDLFIRRAYGEGTTTLGSLKDALRLPLPVIEGIFNHLRKEQLLEVRGMVGEDFSFSLSEAGRSQALDRMRVSQYSGPAPVSLKQYRDAVRAQKAKLELRFSHLEKALEDLVVTEEMLRQLGPALVSQKALFLYGPTGNGKTSIAERLVRAYEDVIVIPYAVEVDGQIVMLYDPVIHESIDIRLFDLDPRWVVCRRPCVIVGGELSAQMLELQLDSATNVYAAPPQMKANNGLLIIDDFGRQVIDPRQLLNRWIVPLDRRVDYLTLRNGVKFQIPFEVMVVFATNLEPTDLADEAFLRRIHNKIYVHAVSDDVFDSILDRVTSELGLESDRGIAPFLRELCLQSGAPELRACYPQDICDIVVWTSQFEDRPAKLTEESARQAAQLYFAQTTTINSPDEV